jgi:hypothetical protein
MIRCEELTDRMPMVRRGSDAWTADEAAHLATCRECRLEWDLVTAGAELGRALAERLDAGGIAQVVVSRLVADHRRQRWRRAAWGVGLAAAASLMLLVGPGDTPERPKEPVAQAVTPVLPLAELDGVEPVVLEEVLAALEDGAADEGTLEAPGFSDLAPSELERLLRNMEG